MWFISCFTRILVIVFLEWFVLFDYSCDHKAWITQIVFLFHLCDLLVIRGSQITQVTNRHVLKVSQHMALSVSTAWINFDAYMVRSRKLSYCYADPANRNAQFQESKAISTTTVLLLTAKVLAWIGRCGISHRSIFWTRINIGNSAGSSVATEKRGMHQVTISCSSAKRASVLSQSQ